MGPDVEHLDAGGCEAKRPPPARAQRPRRSLPADPSSLTGAPGPVTTGAPDDLPAPSGRPVASLFGTPERRRAARRAGRAGFDIPRRIASDAKRGAVALLPSPVKVAALDLGLSVTDDLARSPVPRPSSVWSWPTAGSSRSTRSGGLRHQLHFAAALLAWCGAGRAGDPRRRHVTGVCVMQVAEGSTRRCVRPGDGRHRTTRIC
jgi:hypothetical protein